MTLLWGPCLDQKFTYSASERAYRAKRHHQRKYREFWVKNMIDLFFMLIFPPPPGSHVGIKTDYQLSQCIRVYSTWDIPRQSVCLPIRWGFYYCEKESITRLSTASTSQLTACISIPLFIYLLVSSITLFFVRPINMPDRSRFIGFKVSSLFNFQER